MGPDHTRRFALSKPDTPVVIGYRSRSEESDALCSAFDRLELTRPDETCEADAGRCVPCDGGIFRDWNVTARTPSKSKTMDRGCARSCRLAFDVPSSLSPSGPSETPGSRTFSSGRA